MFELLEDTTKFRGGITYNHMPVWHIKQMIVNSMRPFNGICPTAIRAKSISTTMKYLKGLAAIITSINILTQRRSAALSNGIYSFVLNSGNRMVRA